MPEANTSPTREVWYTKADGRPLADALTSTVTTIRSSQRWLEALNVRHLRLYGGLQAVKNAIGFAQAFTELASATASPISGPTKNIVYSITDTIVSKLAKNRMRAEFITDGGDYRTQRKAKKLNQFSEGIAYQTDLNSLKRDIIRDACVFGTGVTKTYEDDGNIRTERVFPNDIVVDTLEGAAQSPANIFQVQLIDKAILLGRHPDKKLEILKAKGVSIIGREGYVSSLANFIEVIEGWHLQSSKTAGDGRHTIAIDGTVLFDEEWKLPWFPFDFLRFSPAILTFWGRGVAELITNHQAELNRVCRVEAQSHRLMSVPRVWADYSSGIDLAQLQSNRPMTIGFYRNGQAPQAFNWNATTENFVEYKNWIIRDAFEQVGTSQLSAASLKPPDIESAVALREMTDIESDRFMGLAQSIEEFIVAVQVKQVDTAREAYKNGTSFKVNTVGKRFLQTIDWSDIDLEKDAYYVRPWPASQLPQTPQGKKQFIMELLQGRLIDTDRALELFDMPDLKEYMAFYNAACEDIDATIDAIIYDGKYEQPDGAIQNLILGIKRANQAILMGRHSGVPQKNLDLCMTWMEEAKKEAQRVGLLPPDPLPGLPPNAAPGPGGDMGTGYPANPEQAPQGQMLPLKQAA